MSTRQDPYASETETLALLKPDVRSDAEKKLDAILESAGAWEQGVEAYPILYRIAVQLLDQTLQRKPLTDEEIAKIASTPAAVVGSYVHTFARAIEASHGIKGGA